MIFPSKNKREHTQDLRYLVRKLKIDCVCKTCIVDSCCTATDCEDLMNEAQKLIDIMEEKKEGKR